MANTVATYVELLNTIRSNSSTLYQTRVPALTQTNLTQVGKAIASLDDIKMEFCDQLFGVFAVDTISTRMYKNPLSILKGEKIPFGTGVRDIFANPAVASKYDIASESLLKHAPCDIKALYYTVNRKDKYEVDVTEDEFRLAFTNFNEMAKFISLKLNTLYSGDETDEYMLTKNLIVQSIINKHVVEMAVDTLDSATNIKNFVKVIKKVSNLMTYQKTDFNMYKKIADPDGTKAVTPCLTFTPKQNQILVVDSNVIPEADVELLMTAFNPKKGELGSEISRVVQLDDFGSTGCYAMLVDEAWFRINDIVPQKMKHFDNGDTLTIKYWLHHWEMFQYSIFCNAVAFMDKAIVNPVG